MRKVSVKRWSVTVKQPNCNRLLPSRGARDRPHRTYHLTQDAHAGSSASKLLLLWLLIPGRYPPQLRCFAAAV